MSLRIPSAAKALFVLTAAGVLLSGCHLNRRYHDDHHYASPGYGYEHHYRDEDRKHRHRERYSRERHHSHD